MINSNENMIKAFSENDLSNTVFQDKATFELFQSGNTENIPGFDTEQAIYLLGILKPENLDDLMVISHIDKAGIAGYGSKFLFSIHNRKLHSAAIPYLHPILEKNLKPTYGYIFFNEQIEEIIHELSGISIEEAFDARKFLGKKHKQKIDFYYDLFKNGCSENTTFIEGCKTINRDAEIMIKELWNYFYTCIDFGLGNRSIIKQKVLRSYKIGYFMVYGIV